MTEGRARDPDHIEMLLANIFFATIVTWGICGGLFALLGPAPQGKLHRRLLRGILGGITVGLTLFFGAYVFAGAFVLETGLRGLDWLDWILLFCLGVPLFYGWLYLAVGLPGCWFFRLERRVTPPET